MLTKISRGEYRNVPIYTFDGPVRWLIEQLQSRRQHGTRKITSCSNPFQVGLLYRRSKSLNTRKNHALARIVQFIVTLVSPAPFQVLTGSINGSWWHFTIGKQHKIISVTHWEWLRQLPVELGPKETDVDVLVWDVKAAGVAVPFTSYTQTNGFHHLVRLGVFRNIPVRPELSVVHKPGAVASRHRITSIVLALDGFITHTDVVQVHR